MKINERGISEKIKKKTKIEAMEGERRGSSTQTSREKYPFLLGKTKQNVKAQSHNTKRKTRNKDTKRKGRKRKEKDNNSTNTREKDQ